MDEAILEFAEGYDTIVGERGVTLSGGQKQRVAIARTLMQDAPILIFDDSLSAVDAETDAADPRLAARGEGQRRTVILISHRITTLMQADLILVLRRRARGRDGHPRASCCAKNGIYRQHLRHPDEPAERPRTLLLPQTEGGDMSHGV